MADPTSPNADRVSAAQGGWARLPTAARLVAILGLLLLPLGIIAAFASANSAADARLQRRALLEADVRNGAKAVSNLVAGARLALRDAAPSATPDLSAFCARTAAALTRAGVDGHARITARGQIVCDGPAGGLRAASGAAPRPPSAANAVQLVPTAGQLLVSVQRPDGWAQAAITSARIAQLVAGEGEATFNARLSGPGGEVAIDTDYRPSPLQRTSAFRREVPGTPLVLNARGGAHPLSAIEILSILLPILMWLAASLISWLVADRLLLRPIVRLRDAVRAWQPGRNELEIPTLRTPATEIRELGDAFRASADAIAAREADLERGAGRQMRLVREVHHRVKNNLQVVASLLNLHARGARTPEAAAAYASILRRVDALAVVHRNHFAELEENKGVSLRTLLSELTANLRGNAAPGSERMGIGIEAETLHATQDVAVSVAFLVTEIVEYAMLCAAHAPVEIELRRADAPGRARLSIIALGVRDAPACDEVDTRQFERVTVGLARQLRSQLVRSDDGTEFALEIPVLDE